MTDQHNTAPAVWDPTARGGAGGWVRNAQQPATEAAPVPAPKAAPETAPAPAPQAAPRPTPPPAPPAPPVAQPEDAPTTRLAPPPSVPPVPPPPPAAPPEPAAPADRRPLLLIGGAVLLVLAIGGGLLLASGDDDKDKAAAPVPTVAPPAPATGAPQPVPTAAPPTTADTTPSTRPSASATAVDGPLAASQAKALNDLLPKSGTVKIGNLVAQVGGCPGKETVEKDAKEFDGLAAQYQTKLDKAPDLTVSDVPGGTDLLNSVKSAWQSSVDANKAYAAWARAVNQQGCTDPASVPDKKRADELNSQATKAKSAFLAKWSSVAEKYGLTAPPQDGI